MGRQRDSWTYYGITISPADTNGSGIRWAALVNGYRYAGYLRADTKDGMRALIREHIRRETKR